VGAELLVSLVDFVELDDVFGLALPTDLHAGEVEHATLLLPPLLVSQPLPIGGESRADAVEHRPGRQHLAAGSVRSHEVNLSSRSVPNNTILSLKEPDGFRTGAATGRPPVTAAS
jgi:hypothetical protein